MKITRILQGLFLACLLTITITHCGCGTSAQKAAFNVAGSTAITVPSALRLYNVAAAQGRTTIEQNQKVKAAYLKYQASFALLCDAGAAYSAGGQDSNAPAAAALQQATINSAQSISDFLTLVQSFGVKL